MRHAKVIEAWVEQRAAAAGSLQALGPTLYVDDHPVACWLDRADENGAQIVLYAVRMGRSWLQLDIHEAVRCIRGTSLRVPWPLPSPTPTQHVENTEYLMGAWRRSIAMTARSTRYAWGHYQSAKLEAAQAKLYAWAFDLPEPRSNIPRKVMSRARRNAVVSRRENANKDPEASRDMLRALWRGGREIRDIFLGPVMLRLSSDNQTIETSLGEKVDIADVPVGLLWGLTCECRQRRHALIWRIVSERPRIGRWSVQVIHADGSIHVGCHDLPFAEIARLAVTLGLQ
ncbi:MAG: hypothetical protein M3N97_03630 [Pseudomonadota bacterium]|nr:hypothetical protein [Pseudomonadota bacterium]